MRTGFVLLAALMTTAAATAGDDAIAVAAGGRYTVSFDKSVATLYIADPSVLDAHGVTDRIAYLIGKRGGRTQIVALDADGKTVLRREIVVTARRAARTDSAENVVLQRGFERVTYACSGSQCRVAQRSGGGKSSGEPAATPTAVQASQMGPDGAQTAAGPTAVVLPKVAIPQ